MFANVVSEWIKGNLLFKNRAGGVIFGVTAGGPTEGLTVEDQDAQNATLLAAQLAKGLLTHNSKSGGGTLTVDTGANLDAAFPDWEIGTARRCHYVNRGNQTVTLTAGASGTTLVSAQTIATLQGRTIWFLKTAAATYSVWAE